MVIQRQPACVPEFLGAELPATAISRDEAIRFLLQELVGHGRLEEASSSAVFAGLLNRETLGSTSIGRGIAIPHLRVKGLPDFLVIRGCSKMGVSWPGTAAGQSVHHVFLVLSPNDQPGGHLRLLEHISRLAREIGPPG